MQCTVSSGDLPLEIEWKLFGEKLKDYPGVSISSMGKRMSILAIEAVSWRHVGNYTCVARNIAGESEFTAPLLVNGMTGFFFSVLPQILPFDFGERPMFSGEAAQVTCLVSSGDQPLELLWTFGSMDVSRIAGVTTQNIGRKGSILLIDPVSENHRGNYTCTARNKAGVANFSANLRINGISYFLFGCSVF